MPQFEGMQLERKFWLVRKLLDERVKESFFLRRLGKIDSMTDFQVMGTPEGSIVTIVESYNVLCSLGAPVEQIFSALEAHRQPRGQAPSHPDLMGYVKYRLRLEHKSGRRLTDGQITRAVTITQNFIEQFCIAPAQESAHEPARASAPGDAEQLFMIEVPHPDSSKPLVKFNVNSGESTILYYEYPRTIGEVAAGIEPLYRYPQAAVVCNETRPMVIVRIEESIFGTTMLCAVGPTGKRSNFGTFAPTSREEFMKKVLEIFPKVEVD
jgi:hypothetical protein